MSNVAVKGNASGTGTFTIAAPNSNNDRQLDLPDEAGTVLTNASDISAANLTGDVAAERITNALNATGSAPIYACRAWVNFDGNTAFIRDSGNVSSITENSSGDYNINFANALIDDDYAIVATSGRNSIGFGCFYINTGINVPTTSSFRLQHRDSGNTLRTVTYGLAAVFR